MNYVERRRKVVAHQLQGIDSLEPFVMAFRPRSFDFNVDEGELRLEFKDKPSITIPARAFIVRDAADIRRLEWTVMSEDDFCSSYELELTLTPQLNVGICNQNQKTPEQIHQMLGSHIHKALRRDA